MFSNKWFRIKYEKKIDLKILYFAKEMKKEINSKNIVVTQGKNGVFMFDENNKIIKCPAFARKDR